VLVEPMTDFPERFADLIGQQVLLDANRTCAKALVIALKWVESRPCLKLDCAQTREQAEAFRGAVLKIPESRAVNLSAGEYFWHQIVGLRVVNRTGEDLGKITEVMRLPCHDVYVAERAMIPAVKEIVTDIDLESGTMTVDLPPEQ
jgi:16S rRNA processing protein RimM